MIKVKFKGNEGAVRYRGVSFIGADAVEVTPEWFERCSNPNIVEAKAKTKKAPVKAVETE